MPGRGAGSAPGFPANMGNGYLVGIEAESSGVAPADWTADQLRVWPHLGAAIEAAYLQTLPAELRLQLGHREYSSEGKIDPAFINLDTLRASINQVLDKGTTVAPQAGGTTVVKEWDEVASKAEIKAAVREVLTEQHPKQGGKGGNTSVVTEAQWTAANVQNIIDAVARCEKLLQAIATAVAPRRIALAVWGYKGGSARTDENGVALDAYATLNGVHRQVHTPAGVIESPVADPESEVK